MSDISVSVDRALRKEKVRRMQRSRPNSQESPMTSQSSLLEPLINELHWINLELSNAAKPLQWLHNLDDPAREEIGRKLRAGLSRWEDVTRRIHNVLEQDGATEAPLPPSPDILGTQS